MAIATFVEIGHEHADTLVDDLKVTITEPAGNDAAGLGGADGVLDADAGAVAASMVGAASLDLSPEPWTVRSLERRCGYPALPESPSLATPSWALSTCTHSRRTP